MNDLHCRLPPTPPTSKPPQITIRNDCADGYCCVADPPSTHLRHLYHKSDEDDGLVIVGTSSSLGGVTVHRNRRALISKRINRPESSQLEIYGSSMPLYDEVSAQTTISTLSPSSRRTDK